MKVRTALYLNLYVAAALSIILFSFLFYYLQASHAQHERVKNSSEILSQTAIMVSLTEEFLMTQVERSETQWLATHNRLLALLPLIADEKDYPIIKSELEQLDNHLVRMKSNWQDRAVIKAAVPIQIEELNRINYAIQAISSQMLLSTRNILNLVSNINKDATDLLYKQQQNSNITMIGFTLMLILLTCVHSWFAVRKILTPLKHLGQGVERIHKGEFDKPIPLAGRDELSELTAAFNHMMHAVATTLLDLESHIASLKENQQEIGRLKNLLSNIVDSMPSILIGVDKDCSITQWNTEASRKTGVPPHEALNKNLSDVFPEMEPEVSRIQKAIHERQPQSEKRIRHERNDENYLSDMKIYPLASNGIEGAVVRLDDVTELEKKEQQLRQAQKMETVGTLAGGLAHDFNNVLGGIVGTLSIMRFKLETNKQLQEEELAGYLETMEKSGNRATEMVRQLMTLSRNQALTMAPLDLNHSVKHIIQIAKNSFDKSIRLEVGYSSEPAMIMGDATQIEQVLLNLCVNGAHAMTIMRSKGDSWGGVLEVVIQPFIVDKFFQKTYDRNEGQLYWHLRVKDSGVGMDEKTKEQIFTPFFTTKTVDQGTGLGLAMVYNIISQHDGIINLYAEPGNGTQFNIYFPQHQPTNSTEKGPLEYVELPHGEATVLVVDDEEVMRSTAKDILEEFGYTVITAQNGLEAFNIFQLKHTIIDVVLLDMVMPEMSGPETFRAMQSVHPEVKVILTSGFQEDDRISDLLQEGVAGFIQKPYTLAKLLSSIKETV